MERSLDRTLEALTRTPRILRAMLSGIDESWTLGDYGPDTFSPFDVVGRLIHGERTEWIPQARIILDHGESRPFDRYAQLKAAAASRWPTCWASSNSSATRTCAHWHRGN